MKDFMSKIRKNLRESQYSEEIKKLMDKYELTPNLIKQHIENMTIYIDFDEIAVNLISPWLEYMKNNGIINPDTQKPYINKDITSFNKFNEIPGAMKFLDDFYLYHSLEDAKKENPNYTRHFSEVKLKDDAIELFEILKNNNLLKNVKILTSSAPKTHWSKYEFIAKNLPFIDLKTQMITTGDKSNINDIKQFAILIDDGEHNHINATKYNDFITTFLLDYHHNQELKTREDGAGKRIFRINSLNEQDFFDKFLLAAVQDMAKKIQKDLDHTIIQLPYYQNYIQNKKDNEVMIEVNIENNTKKQENNSYFDMLNR